MNAVFEYTRGMEADVSTSYCPGCTHGIAHRLVMEVLDEMGELENTVGIAPVGCSIAAPRFMKVDMTEAFHGRAPAVATGMRRVLPDKMIFTYQGDGDLTSIGGNEILHAAERGEKFTTFFINNAIYGMTGGQMAPTTLIGQRATTAPKGRTVDHHGMPLRMAEIIAQCDCAVYVERVALDTPAHVRQAKKAVRTALEVQKKRLGFSFVEMLSTCPSNWGVSATKALDWLNEHMIPYYPLGVFRSPEEVK